jgi:hypothetical protein
MLEAFPMGSLNGVMNSMSKSAQLPNPLTKVDDWPESANQRRRIAKLSPPVEKQ